MPNTELIPSVDALPEFNAAIMSFDDDGNMVRFLNHPLDEHYLVEPGEFQSPGSLPPEELQVRAAISKASMAPRDLETQHLILTMLLKSAEHRAAFCRMANGQGLTPKLRLSILELVDLCDKKLVTQDSQVDVLAQLKKIRRKNVGGKAFSWACAATLVAAVIWFNILFGLLKDSLPYVSGWVLGVWVVCFYVVLGAALVKGFSPSD